MHHLLRPLFLFLFLPVFSLGQSAQVDSLKAVLEKAPSDTNKVKTLIELAKKLRGGDPEKSLQYGQEALDLASELEFEKGRALGYKWVGMHDFDQSNYVKAEGFWTKSLEIYQQMGDNDGISNMLNNLGSIYYSTGNNAKALEYFLPALEAGEKTGDKLRVATTTQNIGLIYMTKMATYKEALVYLKKGLALAEELNDLDNISSCNANIGEIHLNTGNDSLALIHFARARKAAEPSSPNLPYIYSKIGEVMKNRKMYVEALT